MWLIGCLLLAESGTGGSCTGAFDRSLDGIDWIRFLIEPSQKKLLLTSSIRRRPEQLRQQDDTS